ncbi:MAG: hypothetical protein QOI22_1199 [Verrucomicrobiota bacterium]
MTIGKIDNSQRTAAKVAGFACLFGMAIVVYSNYGIYEHLIVPGNVAETARNIVAHETLFRLSLVCNVTYTTSVVVLLAALYVILKPVNSGLALVGAFFRLIFAVMWLLTALNMLGALRLLSSASYLQVFEPDRLQALARLHLGANFDDYYVGLPFFSLASTVCSYLWLKSKYIPRGLAIFGVISSAWCVICAFVFLIFPHFNKIVNDYAFDSPMAIFELILSFWLLFKGLRSPEIAAPVLARS